MNFLTRFSLKNVVATFMIVIMIVVGGIYSTGKVKQEAMPNISIPMITTTTIYVGATPEDVAERISRPIQKLISGIQGIKSVKTISNENISIVLTEFSFSKDMDKAKQEIEEAIARVSLPDNAQKPVTSKISMGGFPIMTYSVESSMNINELTKYARDKVQPKLTGVSGISSIEIQGSQDRKIFIKLDSEKLNKNNLTIQDVQNTLKANNITIPAGQITTDSKSMTVKISNKVLSLNELKSIPFVVLPNQSKLISQGMGQIVNGMSELGSAVGELGGAVGQISGAVGQIGSTVGQLGGAVTILGDSLQQTGKGVQQIGQLSTANTQAIALVNMIQKYQAYILSQQSVLYNPQATAEQKQKANEELAKGQAGLKASQDALDKLLQQLQQASTAASKGAATTPGKTSTGKAGVTVGAQGSNAQKSPSLAGKSTTSKQKKNTSFNLNTSSKDMAIKTVFLKDLADIYESEEQLDFRTRSDMKQGIVIRVYKNDDANTVGVAQEIKTALDELAVSNKEVRFNKIEDQSDTVKESVNGMVKEGLLGALFAVIVIALFLRDIRATVIAVVSIPLSILITLILFPPLGITINIVTLAGITVAIGRIVDDSIVVIENIYRRSNEAAEDETIDQEKLVESAAAEVSSAITSSTITTVAVFLPLAFVSGLIGKFFVPFAVTVVICMLASLLVAVTVVPAMCKSILRKGGSQHKHKHSKKGNGAFADGYVKLLSVALRHKVVVILSSLALMAVSLLMVTNVGVQFMPADTTAVLEAKMNLAPGTSVDVTNKEALKFEKYLMGNKDIKTIVSTVGDNSGQGGGIINGIQGSNAASFMIVLKDDIDYDAAAKKITDKAGELSKDDTSIAIRTISSTGQRDNFSIIVKGDNMKDITTAAKMITNSLKGEKNFTNLKNNLADKKKEISVEIDNTKAAKKGLTPLVVAGLVRGIMTDSSIMTIKDNGKDMDVQLGFKDGDINSLEKIRNLKVSVMGISFKLNEVANISEKYGPVSISELDGNQYAAISADVNGNDTQTIATEAMKKVDAIKDKLPATTTYELGGSSKDIQEGFSQMGMSMAIAVLLVYIVMMLAFGEATAPFAILFSLPFAVVGAVFALFFTGQSVTLPTLIGMLMLIGIVVTNAIVLLDRVQKNRKRGMSITDSLLEAGSVRLRPIFMTAIATVMALVPLSLGFSKGTVLSQGLGIVVIGGLTLSTVLTLFIVPVMYATLEGFKERKGI